MAGMGRMNLMPLDNEETRTPMRSASPRSAPPRFLLVLAVSLLLVDLLHRVLVRRPTVSESPIEMAASTPYLAETPATQSAEPLFAASETLAAPIIESPMDRHRLMMEQVTRMREYAGLASPDDPFALTEEQIEEFQRQGDPIIW